MHESHPLTRGDGRSTDAGARVFRAALPGWQSGIHRADLGEEIYAPGRIWLELAVLVSALTIVIPFLCPLSLAAAWKSWTAGNSRGRAALAAAAWCGVLGGAIRIGLGIGLVP